MTDIDGGWLPFTTTDGSEGLYRQVGDVVEWRLIALSPQAQPPLARFLFSLPPYVAGVKARAARLRRMHHQYRRRRRSRW